MSSTQPPPPLDRPHEPFERARGKIGTVTFWLGVVLIALLIVLFSVAWAYSGTIPFTGAMSRHDPGPRLLPRVLALVVAGFTLIEVFTLAFRPVSDESGPSTQPKTVEHQDSPSSSPVGERSYWRSAAISAVVIGYVVLLPFAGFLVATPFAIIGILLVIGFANQPVSRISLELVATCVILLAVIYGLFEIQFRVQLPSGSWWQ